MKKPNILWILAEDMCPQLGCYGDTHAKTPCLDDFYNEEDTVKFEYASSVYPVCSAARSTLMLGNYGTTLGVSQHRSKVDLPKGVKILPQLMKEAGYYTAIGKTDFNFPIEDEKCFDRHIEAGLSEDTELVAERIAQVYKECQEETPFFIMHTLLCTHQSQYGYTNDSKKHRESMPRLQEADYCKRTPEIVPKYHYACQESMEIWGQYYEKITTMDRMFGEIIEQLKNDNVYEDTIIFFFGDNGHGIPGGKCHLWDEGVHVPFLVRIPPKYSYLLEDVEEKTCKKYVSFVDFAPTVLEIAGQEVPYWMSGKSLISKKESELSSQTGTNPTAGAVISCADRMGELYENYRCVRNRDYLYLKSFAPTKYYHMNSYTIAFSPWFSHAMIAESKAENEQNRKNFFVENQREEEQLFAMNTDSAQLKNICQEEGQQQQVHAMQQELYRHILRNRDGVYLPESLAYEYMEETGKTTYELLLDEEIYPLNAIVALEKAHDHGIASIPSQWKSVTHPVLIYYYLRKFQDQMDGEIISQYLTHASDTIRTYAAYLLLLRDSQDVEATNTVIDVIKTTNNYTVFLFMLDLFSQFGKEITKILYALADRFMLKDIHMDARYLDSLDKSLYNIFLKYDMNIPEGFTHPVMLEGVEEQVIHYYRYLENCKH